MHVLSAGILICLSAPGFGGHGDDQPTQQVLRIEPDGTWRLFGVFSKTVLVPESYTVNEKVPVTVAKDRRGKRPNGSEECHGIPNGNTPANADEHPYGFRNDELEDPPRHGPGL